MKNTLKNREDNRKSVMMTNEWFSLDFLDWINENTSAWVPLPCKNKTLVGSFAVTLFNFLCICFLYSGELLIRQSRFKGTSMKHKNVCNYTNSAIGLLWRPTFHLLVNAHSRSTSCVAATQHIWGLPVCRQEDWTRFKVSFPIEKKQQLSDSERPRRGQAGNHLSCSWRTIWSEMGVNVQRAALLTP